MDRRHSLLRLFVLLLCLLGAQQVALAHGFEHLASTAAPSLDDDDSSPVHAQVCGECLSALGFGSLHAGRQGAACGSASSHMLCLPPLPASIHAEPPLPRVLDPPGLSRA